MKRLCRFVVIACGCVAAFCLPSLVGCSSSVGVPSGRRDVTTISVGGPEGGTLRISCEPARGHRVLVVVADTGPGIKPEHLGRIFDLYFSTKPKGSGIGLSMVFRTIQMHDGEIEVESTVGKGTTFRVLLPQAS